MGWAKRSSRSFHGKPILTNSHSARQYPPILPFTKKAGTIHRDPYVTARALKLRLPIGQAREPRLGNREATRQLPESGVHRIEADLPA